MFRSTVAFSLCSFACTSVLTIAQSSPAQEEPSAQFRTFTDLVVLDVVATGADQNPIQHLTASSFAVFENGKPQTIKVFEEHDAAAPASTPPMPQLQSGRYTNFSLAPTSSAVNVFLLDMVNSPFNAQAIVRNQALKFLDDMRPGTQIAIFTLTKKLALLQGFTSEPAVLRAQLESTKANPIPPRLLTNVGARKETEADGPDTLAAGSDAQSAGAPEDAALATIAAARKQSLAELASDQVRQRVQITLAGLNQLARYLSNIPGRKNLIWFSSSFPITILPDPSVAPIDPFLIETSAQNEFRQTLDLMALSRVSVYPVSASGLTMPLYRADRDAPWSLSDLRQFNDNLASEITTMNQIAEATGGRAFVETNDLKGAAEEAIRAGSNYYTIAYAPTDHTEKGEYRKIEVKLEKPNIALDYRRGYYAEDSSKLTQNVNQTSAAGNVDAQYSAMRTAMLHGAPQPTQIILVADVRPSIAGTEPRPAVGNQLTDGISGPFRRYTVEFLTIPKQVNCSPAKNATYHCALAFLTMVYDGNGNRVNTQADGMTFDVPADRYDWTLTHSLSFSQQISVPTNREYFLRAAIRNVTDNRIGAVELRVAEISVLPPLSSTAVQPVTVTGIK